MSTELRISPSARATSNDPVYTDSGLGVGDLGIAERLLRYGAILGVNVRKVARVQVVTAAGAPGTTTVDLSTAKDQEGNNLGTGATTIVFVEQARTLGSDSRLRLSAANPVAFLSGTTDTFTLGGHQILVDALQHGTLGSDAGLAFDATHKNITIESTAGCTTELLVGVI